MTSAPTAEERFLVTLRDNDDVEEVVWRGGFLSKTLARALLVCTEGLDSVR